MFIYGQFTLAGGVYHPSTVVFHHGFSSCSPTVHHVSLLLLVWKARTACVNVRSSFTNTFGLDCFFSINRPRYTASRLFSQPNLTMIALWLVFSIPVSFRSKSRASLDLLWTYLWVRTRHRWWRPIFSFVVPSVSGIPVKRRLGRPEYCSILAASCSRAVTFDLSVLMRSSLTLRRDAGSQHGKDTYASYRQIFLQAPVDIALHSFSS